MWLPTVFGARPSRAAMVALLAPVAITSSTSRSRRVSPLSWDATGREVIWPSTREATAWVKITSPAATTRMARSISFWSAPLAGTRGHLRVKRPPLSVLVEHG